MRIELWVGCRGSADAGTQRWSVGIDTHKFFATFLAGSRLVSSFVAETILLSAMLGFRPLVWPPALAAASRAQVCSATSSRSICADWP
jgi:hypothetical protein